MKSSQIMKLVSYLLIMGILSVVLLGSSAVNFGSDHGHENTSKGCIISAIQGTSCPEEKNPFSSASFHINVLKASTIAVFSQNSGLNLLNLFFVLTLLLAVAAIMPILPSNIDGKIFNLFSLFGYKISAPCRQKYTSWLSLHEKRDPALLSPCRS